MSVPLLRAVGLAGSLLYAGFIVWVYATGPATMAEMAGGVAASLNAYRADEQSFQEGLVLFRAEKFEAARTAFDRSDPARRDSRVQYYVAYSYYRQGWGRVWSDNVLFTKGLEALDRAVSVEPSGRVTVSDPTLGIQASDELRAELNGGLRTDASDFNPFRVLRKRK